MIKTKINWCDATCNIAIGCQRAGSPGCDNCYADTWAKRFPRYRNAFGPNGARVPTGPGGAQKIRSLARKCAKQGVRASVFASSLCDVFEDRPELVEPRERLWKLILDTPNLDWLLLTKRPENITRFLPCVKKNAIYTFDGIGSALDKNIWLGTTVENQEQADKRIPAIINTGASNLFLSIEPMLGPIYLNVFDWGDIMPSAVIVGGESGPHARPMNFDWVWLLRDQCQEAGVPFFFKQWGEWAPNEHGVMERIGKKAAGRLLDGVEHNALPWAVGQVKK